ncbi:MAG TPA: hypothetical protein VLH59_02715 [Ignavibacteriaceae bacterium]|nr:hypothetical protein [Ignavibacteriaceae bacterium]
MNIESEKLKLIEWIKSVQDDSIIAKIKFLKDHQSQKDWWDEISEEEKEAIEEGLKDIAEGNVVPHEQVKKRYEKWL